MPRPTPRSIISTRRPLCPGAADRFWDGGITGCNNPAVAAVVEAPLLGQTPQEIRVLSLGTATVSLPLAPVGAPGSPLEAPRPDSTLTGDRKKLATAILDDPPDIASFIAHAVTGGNTGLDPAIVSRVVRMSPLISPLPAAGGGWMPPAGWSVAQFQYLSNLDFDVIAQDDVAYIDDYCRFWLADNAPNQPIRPNGATFDPQNPGIDYAKFSQAKAAWGTLFPPIAGPRWCSRAAVRRHSNPAAPQCDISTGTVMLCRIERVAPPSKSSRTREWP